MNKACPIGYKEITRSDQVYFHWLNLLQIWGFQVHSNSSAQEQLKGSPISALIQTIFMLSISSAKTQCARDYYCPPLSLIPEWKTDCSLTALHLFLDFSHIIWAAAPRKYVFQNI